MPLSKQDPAAASAAEAGAGLGAGAGAGGMEGLDAMNGTPATGAAAQDGEGDMMDDDATSVPTDTSGDSTTSEPAGPDPAALRKWEEELGVLELALELMNNLAAGAGGDDDDDAEEEWGSDDEERMEALAASQGARADESVAGQSLSVVHQQLGAAQAPSHVMALLDRLLQFPLSSHGAALPTPPAGGLGSGGGGGAAAEGGSGETVMDPKLFGDVCDLRSHSCLCLGHLLATGPGTEGGDVGTWRQLMGVVKAAYEESLRLGPLCDIAEDWVSALMATTARWTRL